MPSAPLRSCAQPGCPELVERGRCKAHRRQAERYRGTKQERGYDAAWERVRLIVLARDPLCRIGVKCADLPITQRISTAVDHIVPIRVAPHLRLVLTNLQGSCTACNTWKRDEDARKYSGINGVALGL